MKRSALTSAVMLVLGSAGAVLAPPAAAAPGPLAGTWVSVDTDGSNQTLRIRGSGRRVYAMTYHDDSATRACGGDPARISGPGRIHGDTVHHVGRVICLPGGNVLKLRVVIAYDYNAGTDTMTDEFGVVWRRAG